MPTFGQTGDQSALSTSTADKTALSEATPSSSGTVTSAAARLWITPGGTPTTARFCIYQDSGGDPGSLLAVSDEVTVSNTTEQEVQFPFSGTQRIDVVSGTPYHIGPAWRDPGAGSSDSINYSRGTTADSRVENSSYAPNPFGTPNSLSGPLDAYVTYQLPISADGAFFDFF